MREHIFVTGFSRQYMMIFLTQNLHFLLMKLDSEWVYQRPVQSLIGAVLIQD
jgi:hypothetical protein